MNMEGSMEMAEKILARYTLVAMATGAVPVPAASGAIVAENAAMIAQIANVMGEKITISKVVSSLGALGMLNLVGRSLFVEAAKLLSWGTLNPLAAVALSGVGSATAGLQTYIIGCLAIEIGKSGGRTLEPGNAERVADYARANYASFSENLK